MSFLKIRPQISPLFHSFKMNELLLSKSMNLEFYISMIKVTEVHISYVYTKAAKSFFNVPRGRLAEDACGRGKASSRTLKNDAAEVYTTFFVQLYGIFNNY